MLVIREWCGRVEFIPLRLPEDPLVAYDIGSLSICYQDAGGFKDSIMSGASNGSFKSSANILRSSWVAFLTISLRSFPSYVSRRDSTITLSLLIVSSCNLKNTSKAVLTLSFNLLSSSFWTKLFPANFSLVEWADNLDYVLRTFSK